MFLSKLLPIMALITLVVVSCREKDDAEPEFKFDKAEVQIDYGKSVKLNLSEADGATYESSDEVVASVTNDGIVLADLVGNATIKAFSADNKRFAQCEVTVLPTLTLYKDPIMASGITRADVKLHEKTLRTFAYEGVEGILIYEGENLHVRNVMYLFNSTSGYLEACYVFLPTLDKYKDLINRFLVQRYVYEGFADDHYIYSRGNVLVGVGEDAEIGLYALYLLKTSPSKTASAADLTRLVQAGKKVKQAMVK